MNYYNEIDPFAASWLRELIKAGLIPDGYVDERSIADVKGSDLTGYTQCHFFAGIGGWARALELSGWPADRPVWTGSCPCQSLSVEGLGKGADDKRHLWPEFARLICECEPSTVFGEQVASKLGRQWLSGVRLDLEAMGYGVGAADLCAASIGAPHIRQRLWWVAQSASSRCNAEGKRTKDQTRNETRLRGSERGCCDNAADTGDVGNGNEPGRLGAEQAGPVAKSSTPGFWSTAIWHHCRYGKTRRIPVEPALFPLAYGISNRVGILRGAGNAIVPAVAAAFIKSYQEVVG